MPHAWAWAAILWPVAAAAAQGPAVASYKPPREYSVEMRLFPGVTGPEPDFVSRLYVGGDDRTRVEVYDRRGRLYSLVIHRLDRDAVYSFDVKNRTYVQQSASELMARGDEPVPASLSRYLDRARRGKLTLTREGQETIAGQLCDKYAIGYGANPPFLLWLSAVTGLPVKHATPSGAVWTEWSHLQVGPQPPSLFEIPPGYVQEAAPR